MKKLTCYLVILMISSILFYGCQKGKENADLETSNKYILDITKPRFIDVREATKILKSRPVGIEPWQIYYASENYIYVTYDFGTEFIFRYNVKENIIDRALDVRSLHKDISGPSSTNCIFLSNGLYAYFRVGTTSIDSYSNLYKADFVKKSVTLIAELKSGDDYSQSVEEDYYEVEELGKSAREYLSRHNINPSLPKLYDWSTVVQIDEDKFFLIMPPENASPGKGYYYFKFVVIDISQNEVIQEFRIDSID